MSNNSDNFLVFPVRKGVKKDVTSNHAGNVCPNCKTPILGQQGFCGQCGTKVQVGTQFVQQPINEQTQYNQQSPIRQAQSTQHHTNAQSQSYQSLTGNNNATKTSSISGAYPSSNAGSLDNIKSGIALTANPAILHRQLINKLCASAIVPLDVFEELEIIREEKYYVPSYCFYCSATASFTYEIAQWRTHKTAIDLGDRTRVEKEKIKDYKPMSGNAAVSEMQFASGNRELVKHIERLYIADDYNKLEDYRYLNFPNDVMECENNLPQTRIFIESVKPRVEEMLRGDACNGLSGKDYRDLAMGGSKIDIDREATIHVLLGIYNVVYKYNNQEYSIWFASDGEKAWCEQLPVDQQRQRTISEQQQKLNSIPENKSKTLPSVIIIAGLILTPLIPAIGLVLAAIGIAFLVMNLKQNMDNKEQHANAQREIDAFYAQSTHAAEQFKARKQPLRGIYATMIAGDESAF